MTTAPPPISDPAAAAEWFRSASSADRLRYVADLIEQHPDRWDQAQWSTPDDVRSCGSAACIGGWALALMCEPSEDDVVSVHDLETDAAQAYGLTEALGEALFYGTLSDPDVHNGTRTLRPSYLPALMRSLARKPEPRRYRDIDRSIIPVVDLESLEDCAAGRDDEVVAGHWMTSAATVDPWLEQ